MFEKPRFKVPDLIVNLLLNLHKEKTLLFKAFN